MKTDFYFTTYLTESECSVVDNYIRFLAAQYYLQTELYDLTLPGFWSEHGEWIP